MTSFGKMKSAIFDQEEKRQQYQSHIRGLNAYDRHKKFMNDYAQFYSNGNNEKNLFPIKTDKDTIREGYRFIISEEDDMDSTWAKRLVKRYHDKLYKEYCIADMSGFKTGKIGLRWRTEKEVVSGKGQFICGNKKCDERNGLGNYEVNFSYVEAGEQKQALVKLMACERCAEKLVYKRQKEKQHSDNNKDKYSRKREREREASDDSSDDEPGKSDYRKTKAKKGASARGDSDEENFDEYLQGMFP